VAQCRVVLKPLLFFCALTAPALADGLRFDIRTVTPDSRGWDNVDFILSALTRDGRTGRAESGWFLPEDTLKSEDRRWLESYLDGESRLNWAQMLRDAGPQYREARARRHGAAALPETLEEFISRSGYRSWPRETVELSGVKKRTRIIYRSPELRVAETLDPPPARTVRETEVIQRRPGQDQWDFYVYGRDGRLTEASLFDGPSRPAPVPMACMACHYDRSAHAFTAEPLSYWGFR
jgi:hypothetical protein